MNYINCSAQGQARKAAELFEAVGIDCKKLRVRQEN